VDEHLAVHRAIVVVDVEKFGDVARTNDHQLAVREGLYEAVERAFTDAGIDWQECTREDRGDGILILVSSDTPKSRLVDQLPTRLVAALRRHNAKSSVPSQIRLRVALDAGEVHYDSHGITGEALNRACRLLDAGPLKDALSASPGVLALITSDWFYREIVRHEPAAAPASYQAVQVTVKETDVRAWMYLPDGSFSGELSPAAAPGRDHGVIQWQVWRRVSGLALLLSLGVVAILLWSGPEDVLKRGDKLLSGLLAAAALVASVVTLRRTSLAARWTGADFAVAHEQAARDLARWVERQWRQEAAARLLDRPEPLRVRWSSTSRPVAPVPGEVLGASSPQGRVVRLRLGGDVSEVVDKFVQLPHRQLVVLGQPGAGKSVLVLLLALGLLRRWRVGQPVPVLLNLSSWNPNREHLDAWLVRRLVEEYPVLGNRDRYGPDVAVRLVTSEAVLPMLDGLDEMPQARHAAAIAGLNDAIGGPRPVVVASRVEEYQDAVGAVGAPLGRAAVVELEPVDIGAAAAYLSAGQVDGPLRWAPVIARLRATPDGPLALALSTPLMVYLARAVYSAPDRDPGQLADPRRWTVPDLIEDHLLDAYLPALYSSSVQPIGDRMTSPALRVYPVETARHGLAYLAEQMATLGTRDLAWWQLSRTVPRFGLAFGLTVRLLAAVGFGLAFGFTYAVTHDLARGLTYGITYGLAFGLALTAGLRFTSGWAAGLVTGSTAGTIAGFGVWLALGPEYGIPAALEAGFISGLGIGLITRRDKHSGNRPRQIELSAARLLRAIGRSLPIGLVAGLVLGLVFVSVNGHPILFAAGLAYGLPFMLGHGASEAIVMPADDRDSVTPKSLLHGERAATIAQVVAIGLAAWIADLLTTWLTGGLTGSIVVALGASLMFGLVFGLAAGLAAGVNSPWLRYQSAQGWFALRGRLPWQLMRFLEDAYRRGVLRQLGGTYQFRHARLQDHLAGLNQSSTPIGGGTSPATAAPAPRPAKRSRWLSFPSWYRPASAPPVRPAIDEA
jgi:hypothetical protein